jgi:membrane associated rhomboid family serine protease
MLTRLSGLLADAIIGLVVAGVCAGLLVPAMGDRGGPVLALSIAASGVLAAVVIGQVLRRGRAANRR